MNIYHILYLFFESFLLNSLPLSIGSSTLLAMPVLSIVGINIYNVVLASIILGIGSATGKLVTYTIGIFLSKPLRNNKNLLFIKRISNSKKFYIVFFFLNLLPLVPFDDLLFLSFGIERLNILKYYLIAVPARIIKSFSELYVEIFVLNKVSEVSNIPLFELSIISAVMFIIFSIIFFKFDWEKYFSKWTLKEK
jgi:membrane protein YqaA with SNARE-associated domain